MENSINCLGPYVFDDIVDGVLLLARDGSVSYMNKKARDILSISEEDEIVSLPGTWLRRSDNRNDELCQIILDALYEKGQKISKSVSFYTANGERRVLHVKSSFWSSPSAETQSGVLLILQDVTEDERAKKEREDAIFIFSLFLAIVGIWTIFYAALTHFGIELPKFFMTFLLLGLGLILAAAIVWKTDLKKSDIGLSFKNIRRSLFFHITATIVICLILIGAKSIAIASGSTLFPKDQPFFDFGFSLGMKLYPISVLLQEFLSQCVIHESLIRILKGKHSAVYAILLSAVLFCTLHIHRGFGYMIGSFALICFISAIYRRQRSVWGLCITHYAVSMMAFFLHWL